MIEWEQAKQIIGSDRLTLGPQASHQLLNDPSHYCMVLSRYRNASSLIGSASSVLELGCGEGLGAGILANGRVYVGLDADDGAVQIARDTYHAAGMVFRVGDIVTNPLVGVVAADAVVSLDVIEHIPQDEEDAFMLAGRGVLPVYGVMVVGTPSANAAHLASPQSKAGHINLYTHDRLHTLMRRYFRLVLSFGMNDVGLHTGHPDMRHYHMMAGIGPR